MQVSIAGTKTSSNLRRSYRFHLCEHTVFFGVILCKASGKKLLGPWSRGERLQPALQTSHRKKYRVTQPLPRFSLWSRHWAVTKNGLAQAATQFSCPQIQSCAMITISWPLATECFILWRIWRVISVCEVTLGKDRIR
jgi:hypothetical protein